MAYEMKNNTGSLWRNLKKEEETHADYTGSVMIDGVEYWQSGYLKESKDGKKYFYQTFKAKNAPRELPKQVPTRDVPDDSDIPF
jgi:hypothetical protein